MLLESEKKELKISARSAKLRADLRKIVKNRHNPFVVNGRVKTDKVISFLTQYNDFINHAPKLFHKIKDKINKL